MKSNIGIVLLALLAVGLAAALIATRQMDGKKQEADAATILDFSNQWTKASLKVDELTQVNLLLNNDLATNRVLLADLSNSLNAISETVTNIRNSLLAANDQIAGQNARIADLQQQNKDLSDRATFLTSEATELTNRIAALTGQIDDTRRQLAESKTNNAYLEKQLQQLIEARADLEHKFDTLASVRAQVQKLEDDLYTSRRLQWMKEGTFQPLKGGQLMVKFRDAGRTPARDENYGLHVELGSDGSARALPLPGAPTNNVSTNVPAR